MTEGVHFAASGHIVALGIGRDGVKRQSPLVEESKVNATRGTGLLMDRRGPGLDVTCPMLVGIDDPSTNLRLWSTSSITG